jgi:hypothetical protein
MSPRGSLASSEHYSPERRTALLLSGVGTAGAYHAGVLRALHEAGVKIDVMAGRGIGAIGALFAAVDGPQRLWEERGFWRSPGVPGFYPWRGSLRLLAAAAAAALLVVAVPLAAAALGLLVLPIDFVLKLLGVSAAGGPAAAYLRLLDRAFAPEGLPTWLPRAAVLVLGAAGAAVALSAWWSRPPRHARGRTWWRLVGAPLSEATAVKHCWTVMWDLVRGAAQLKAPAADELGRRYTELLADNLGQPGFRELLIAAHDLDARRDLVFALVAEGRRRDLIRRPTSPATDERRAEAIDLAGLGRDHLTDAVAASFTIPIATEPHFMRFGADTYWRGETHRLTDRPGAVNRLVDELTALGVAQIVLVSAAPEATGPHALTPPGLALRDRLGEHLQSFEAAAVRDVRRRSSEATRVFTIQPSHNPVGPLDFSGGFDTRSDRSQPLVELMSRGYEDAYLQFIEPIVGASGERVGRGTS